MGSSYKLTAEDKERVEERRQFLRGKVEDAGGVWDEGWVCEGVMRQAGINQGRLDFYFHTPDGLKKLRSVNEVLTHLNLMEKSRPSTAGNSKQATSDSATKARETREPKSEKSPAEASAAAASGREHLRRKGAPTTSQLAPPDHDESSEPCSIEPELPPERRLPETTEALAQELFPVNTAVVKELLAHCQARAEAAQPPPPSDLISREEFARSIRPAAERILVQSQEAAFCLHNAKETLQKHFGLVQSHVDELCQACSADPDMSKALAKTFGLYHNAIGAALKQAIEHAVLSGRLQQQMVDDLGTLSADASARKRTSGEDAPGAAASDRMGGLAPAFALTSQLASAAADRGGAVAALADARNAEEDTTRAATPASPSAATENFDDQAQRSRSTEARAPGGSDTERGVLVDHRTEQAEHGKEAHAGEKMPTSPRSAKAEAGAARTRPPKRALDDADKGSSPNKRAAHVAPLSVSS